MANWHLVEVTVVVCHETMMSCNVCLVAALVIGMIGAFCFIILQVVLLVDFAHRWNEWWLVAITVSVKI